MRIFTLVLVGLSMFLAANPCLAQTDETQNQDDGSGQIVVDTLRFAARNVANVPGLFKNAANALFGGRAAHRERVRAEIDSTKSRIRKLRDEAVESGRKVEAQRLKIKMQKMELADKRGEAVTKLLRALREVHEFEYDELRVVGRTVPSGVLRIAEDALTRAELFDLGLSEYLYEPDDGKCPMGFKLEITEEIEGRLSFNFEFVEGSVGSKTSLNVVCKRQDPVERAEFQAIPAWNQFRKDVKEVDRLYDNLIEENAELVRLQRKDDLKKGEKQREQVRLNVLQGQKGKGPSIRNDIRRFEY